MKICPKCNKEHTMNGRFCSRSCANSRTWSPEDNKKKSESGKKYYRENEDNRRYGWTHTEEDKELKRQRSIEAWDRRGRKDLTQKEIRAARVASVQAYRARKYSSTPSTANRDLIKKIYEHCPDGYEVDHIVAISQGGLHHEENLQYLPALINRKKNKTQNYDRSSIIRWQDVIQINSLVAQ